MKDYSPELVSIHALNNFLPADSSARSQMFSSHFSQKLTLDRPDKRLLMSGLEFMMSKYTLNNAMPETGRLFRIIPRYGDIHSQRSINNLDGFYPEYLVIYENEQGIFNCFTINYHTSYHTHFGFKNKFSKAFLNAREGDVLPKGFVITDTPGNSTEKGFTEYNFGKNLNMAFMSHPAVSEDGIMICEDVLKDLEFRIYDKRDITLGLTGIPVNLYGDENNYKFLPDIGEYINPTKALMYKRRINSSNSREDGYRIVDTPASLSAKALMAVDNVFDEGIFINRQTKDKALRTRVIDIKVYRNQNIAEVPSNMVTQLDKYENGMHNYNQAIVNAYRDIKLEINKTKHRFDEQMFIGHELMNQYVRATLMIRSRETGKPKLSHRLDLMDQYRIEVITETIMSPGVGSKLTDIRGSKGVICYIAKPEEMPVSEDGVRADIVMDNNSTISRMNLGKLYEQYMGQCTVNITKHVKSALKAGMNTYGDIHDYLLGFLRIASPIQYDYFSKLQGDEINEYINDINENEFRLFYPVDNPTDPITMINEIEHSIYQPHLGRVTYTGLDGKLCTTKDRCRIGPIYIMVLQQIADNWLAVSSSSLQHFGIPGPTTKSQKFSKPYKANPVRNVGETESRVFAGYMGREAIAELMDRNLNVNSHKTIYRKLLTSEKPTNIDRLIDRSEIPLGEHRTLKIFDHLTISAGFETVYEEED